MAITEGSITGHAVGDDIDFTRTVAGIPDGATLERAWLMVKPSKADADVDAIISKDITTSPVNGTGHITDDGTDDGITALLYQIPKALSRTVTAKKVYVNGIKVRLSTNKVDLLETGTFVLDTAVVQAVSYREIRLSNTRTGRNRRRLLNR